MPVQAKPCRTCPFAGSNPIPLPPERYTQLINNLNGNGQHFCHSADNRKICRGGRDIQLRLLCSYGLLDEPTDEAFNQAIAEALCSNSES